MDRRDEERIIDWAITNGDHSSTGVAGYRFILERFKDEHPELSRTYARDLARQAREKIGVDTDSGRPSNSVDSDTIEAAEWSAANPSNNIHWAGADRIKDQFPNLSRFQCRNAANMARRIVEARTEVEDSLYVDPENFEVRQSVIDKLRKNRMTTRELSNFLNCDDDNVTDIIESLRSSGWSIITREGGYSLGKLAAHTVPTMKDTSRTHSGTHFKIGLVSDTHLCSKYQRLDVAEMAYDEFDRQGISTVYHCGNLIDGYLEHINPNEVLFRGVTDQSYYCANNYPSRAGITTFFISGDCHEQWGGKSAGLNVGEYVQMVAEKEGRNDLKYLSHLEADIEFINKEKEGRSILRLLHPGGGSSYAKSYQIQKTVESYQGGVKPDILACGHYHSTGYFMVRNVHTLLVPSMMDQSSFMRKKRLSSEIGFIVLEFSLDKCGGVSGFFPKFYPFFDQRYHINAGEWEMGVFQHS